jgi:DNA polymerase/3'-5' exonuclease PolX
LKKLKEPKGTGKAVINKTKEYLESGGMKKHNELVELIPVR